MKTAKQLAQEVIEDLPDDASMDAIVEQLSSEARYCVVGTMLRAA